MMGAGKYDGVAKLVRVQTAADFVIVCVINGYAGNGFSAQGDSGFGEKIPTLLREMARSIEIAEANNRSWPGGGG